MMIEKPCWILCTPRTGSSFLCELLNNVNYFPAMEHKNLVDRRGPLERGQAFSEWCRLYDTPYEFIEQPPVHSKMIFHQFFEIFNNVPRDKRYGPGFYKEKYNIVELKKISGKFDSKYVKKALFPDIKFVKLKREVKSNAVSLYTSRTTGKYHIYNINQLTEYMSLKIDIDERKLIEAYTDAKKNMTIWDDFLKDDFLEIDYDDLINNTRNVLCKILLYLNPNLDKIEMNAKVDRSLEKVRSQPRILKMTRSDNFEVLKKLNYCLSKKMI